MVNRGIGGNGLPSNGLGVGNCSEELSMVMSRDLIQQEEKTTHF